MKNYKQEMFTKVYRHLLKQRKKAANGTICAYRTSSGLQCAVGCLISNKKYSESIEGKAAWHGDVQECLPPRYRNFVLILGDLQDVHDNSHPNTWKKQLSNVADKHNLKVPKL